MTRRPSPTFRFLRCYLRLPVTAVLIACFSLWSLHSSYAVSAIWNGTTDGVWATGTNWSATPVPGTGDTATLNNAGGGFTTLNLGSGVTLNTLLFDTASAAAYTIGSGAVNSQTLTLNNGGAITMNSTVLANQLFNSALVLGTDATVQTYTITNSSTTNSLTFAGTITGGSTGTQGAKALNISAAAGGNVILGGIISNGGASSLPITKTGLGILELNGANTYTGITTISAGTVKLGNASGLGAAGNNNHTIVGAGATLDLNGRTIAEQFGKSDTTLTDGFVDATSILTNSSATAASITGDIVFNGAGAFTVNGTGDISLVRAYRGTGTGDVTITKEGANTLILDGTADNAALQVTVNNGIVQLNKGGSGVRALGGATTTIGASGTLRLTTGQANGDQIFSAVNVVNNGTFDLQGQDESFNNMTGTGLVTNGATSDASVLTLGEANGGFTWSGIIQNGAGTSILGLTKMGTGIMTITNTNTYTGVTQVNGTGGGLTLDFAAVGGANDNLISASSAFTMNNTSTSRTQTLTIAGDTVANNQTFNGTSITAAGTRHQIIVNSGVGGGVNLNLGVLSITSGAFVDFVLPTIGAINTTNANTIFSPLVTVNNGAAYARIFGGQVVAFTGDLTYATATNVSALVGYTTTGNLLVDSTSTGNVIQAAGTTDLSTITVTDAAARTLTIGTGNTLRLGAAGGILRSSVAGSLVVGESSNAGTLTTGTLAGADLVLTNGNATGTLTVNSIIANNAGGAVDVIVNGAAGATTILSGPSTYTGTTVVQTGILRATNNLAFGTAAGGVTVIDGAAVEISGGITIGDEALSIIGTGVSSNGALRNVSGTNTYGGLVTLASNAEIQSEAGSTLIFDRPGVATAVTTGSPITFEAVGTGIITFNDALVTTGTANPTIAKNGTGTLNFNAANTWAGTGGFSINGGIVRISNGAALGGTSGGTTVVGNATAANRGSLELVGNITTNEALTLNNSTTLIVNANGAIRNISGNNTITGQVTIDNGAGRINSDSGTLTLAGGLRADPDTDSTRTVTFGGVGNIVIPGVAANVSAARILAITKDGTGTLTLSGANTHSGVTTVSGGTLNVTSASGVGTGNVVVATNTAFNYAAAADAALSIGGTLGITGGTSTVIGGSIGSTFTSAQINVTGAATISNATHRVNIFGVLGTTPTTGTYTLIQGGAGSNLAPTTTPTLGTVFNNTNFTVGALGRTATTLTVGITAQTALTAAFWKGGLTGATNVWAASNGTTQSNWVATSGGADQALVPGAGADLTISNSAVTTAPTATVLGSNMTIRSLTIADTTNGLGLNADGNTLTITPASAATGITMNASVPASTIAANVALGANQTWTIDSANGLTASGIVSGVFSLAKAGTGTLTLSGLNTYSGGTTLSAGTLTTASTQALGLAANTLAISGGTLNLASDTSIAANVTTVSGNATIISNRATANAGITHTLGTLSIGAQTLTVNAGANVTSGTAGLTFGATTLTGAPTFDVGTGANLTLPVVATSVSNFGVTKQGAGTLSITGVSTDAGVLTVNGGTATFNASGRWTGNVIAASGGTIQNTGAGTNSFGANLTVQSGGVYDNQQTGAETVAAFSLEGTGIGGTGAWVNNAAGTTAGTITSTAGITLTGNASVGGAGNIGTASAISGGFALTKVGSGNLQLGAAASTGWTGGLVIEAGNVIGGSNVNTFGADTNAITLGHTSGSANTQLTPFNSFTYLQPLTVKGGNTGVATLMLGTTTGNVVWGGAITLDTHDLTIAKLGTTGVTQVTGGITGTGNLTLDNDATTSGTITLATAAINSTGSISNVGSATGTTTISAPIGSSVTNITQNSATSTLTLSGATIAYSGATTVTAGTLNITGDAAGGTRSRTTLTVAGGATLNSLNTAGQIVNLSGAINLGAGSGTTTLGFDIGSLSNFDQFNSAVAATTANAVVLNFNGLGGIVAGNYDLLTATSGLNTATYSIGSFAGGGGFSYSLATDPTFVRLTAAALSGAIYWGGAVNTSWSGLSGFNTNFATTLGGTNANGTPGVNSNVIFSTSTQTSASLATTLDGAFSIRDLTFNNQVGSGPLTSISIAPGTGGTLTLTPTASTAGINVETGAPASIAISAPITLGAAQTWTVVDAATNLASSGGIGGTADLTKAGAGLLTLSGTNNYVGTTTVNAGVLRAGAANGFNQTSAHTIGASGTLETFFASTVGSITGSGIVQNGSATNRILSIGNDNTGTNAVPITFSGTVRNGAVGTLGITKVGTGVQELSGILSYTGPTAVSAGTLRLSSPLGASAVALTGAGILQINHASALTSANTVNLGTGTTLDLFGNSVTIGALTSVAAATITNTSTAVTPSTATTPGTPALTDALTISPATTAVAALITDGPTRKTQIVLNNSNTSTAAAFNNANTYSGGLVLANTAAGTRLLIGTITGTPFGTGPIIIGQAVTDKAGIYFNTASQTLTNDIVFNTALGTDRVGIRTDSGGQILSGKITANLAPATFTANTATAGSFTLTGQVTGASGLVLDITSLSASATAFNVTLNNSGTANDYSGDTVVNFGAVTGKSATLNLGQANQLPNGVGRGNVILNTVGTGVGLLNLAGFSDTINGLSGTGTVDGTSGTPTLTLGDGNANSNFSGIIRNTAGTLGVTKIGSGTQTLSGVNTFSGALNINGGTLAFNAVNNLGDALAANTIGFNGGTLSYTGTTAANLTAPRGAVTVGTGGGTLNVTDVLGTLNLQGGITSSTAANLTKTGLGTVTVTGSANLTGGNVTVSAGVLNAGFTASGLGAIDVATGATLNLYDGATTTMAISGLTLAAGSTLGFDLNAPGVNDILNLTGTASVTPTVTLNFNNLGGFAAGTYDLINVTAGTLSAGNFIRGLAPSGLNFAFSTINSDQTLRLTTSNLNLVYWTGDQDGNWNTNTGPGNTNWASNASGAAELGALPVATDTLVFSAANGSAPGGVVATSLNNAPVTADSLRFISAPTTPVTTSVTIAPGGASGILTIAPASSNNGISVAAQGGDVTISAPVVAQSNQTWEVVGTSPSSLNVSGAVTITGSITKTGAGSLSLSGSNSGTGGVNLSAGSLVIANSNALGTGAFTIGAGTTINTGAGAITNAGNNAQNWNGNFTFTGTNTLNLGTGAVSLGDNVIATVSASTLTVGGAIGDGAFTFGLTKAGAGALILGAPSTYGGINTITAGTLQVNATTGGLGDATAADTITLNGGTLSLRNNGAGNNGTIIYGSTSNATGYRVQLAATSTINVDNLTANTGNTMQLGALTQASAAIQRNLNVTGANGYNLTLASLALVQGTGQNTTLNPIGANIIITGNVVNPMSGFGSGNFNTLTLDGTSSGNSIAGSITDAVGAVTGGNGRTVVTKSNTSTWTLSGLSATAVSNYTGLTSIDRGTLAITHATTAALTGGLTFGAAAASANVGTLDLTNGSARFTGALNVQTTGATANTVSIGSGRSLRVDGAVSIGYSSAANTQTRLSFTGATGTFTVGSAGAPTNAAFNVGNNSTTNVSNAATLDMSGLGTFYANLGTGTFRVGSATNSGGTAAAGSTLILAANSTIIATTIATDSQDSGVTQVIKLGSGTNVLNATTITIGGSGNTSARGSGTLDFNTSSGTIQIRALDGIGRAAMNVQNGATNTGQAVSGTVNFNGRSADLLLSTLAVGGRSAGTSGSGTGTFSFDTGTLDATTLNIAARTGTLTTGNVTGNVALGANSTIGTLTMSTNSSSASTTGDAISVLNITGGTNSINNVTMGVNTVAGTTGNGSNTDATFNITGGSTTVNTTFTMGAQNSVADAATTNNSALSNLNISAGSLILAGSTNLTMGQATLDDNNLVTAAISITGTGSLTVGGNIQYANSLLGAETNTVTLNGGTLDMTSGNIGGDGTVGTANAGTVTFNAQAGILRNLAQLNGGGASSGATLTKTTAGTLTMEGTNAYTGGTAINGGILRVNSSGGNSLGTTGNITFGGGTLQYTANDTTDYSPRILNSASAINIDTNGQNVTFASSVSSTNTGGLTKSGTGTLTFTAAAGNSYTGTTTVNAGTLLVNNTTGSGTGTGAVTVSNSGTILGGSGTIAGNLTVNAGALIAPGSATATAGTLTIGGSTVVINGNGVAQTRMNFDYSNATGNVGAGVYNTLGWWDTYSGSLLTGNNGQSNDLLNFTAGTTNLSWNTGGKITLNQIGSSYTWLQGDVFNLLDWTALGGGAIGGTFNSAADFDLPSLGSGLAWDTSRFVTTGAIAVVPEPSRALLMLFGLLGLYFRRRRD